MEEYEVAELIEHTTQAAKAYLSGDLDTYFALIRHEDDHVLMSPFGGEPIRGVDTSPEALQATAEFFRGSAEVDLEVVQTFASGDMVVLVAIERQRGEVGGLPEQDWSLRITLVFMRDERGWRQVHRHADALVHPIDLPQLSKLARGQG